MCCHSISTDEDEFGDLAVAKIELIFVIVLLHRNISTFEKLWSHTPFLIAMIKKCVNISS